MFVGKFYRSAQSALQIRGMTTRDAAEAGA